MFTVNINIVCKPKTRLQDINIYNKTVLRYTTLQVIIYTLATAFRDLKKKKEFSLVKQPRPLLAFAFLYKM